MADGKITEHMSVVGADGSMRRSTCISPPHRRCRGGWTPRRRGNRADRPAVPFPRTRISQSWRRDVAPEDCGATTYPRRSAELGVPMRVAWGVP